MEAFGFIGMIFGMIGFIFGVVSFVKVEKLIATLKENKLLEKNKAVSQKNALLITDNYPTKLHL